MYNLQGILSLLLVSLGLSHHTLAASSDICTSKVCEYHLTIRWARTMVWRTADGKKSFNVQVNGRKLEVIGNSFHLDDEELGRVVGKESVHTADGYTRNLITVNDQFPGPAIEVMHGAQVVVHVTNKMWTQATSIHWHGVSQKFTPWMDGVPYVTQCPIAPRQTFTYRFVADPPGTHWWHSHFKSQRLDGLFGMLVIHKHFPDLPYTNLMVHDWHHMESHTHETLSPFTVEEDHAGPGDHVLHPATRDASVDGVELGAHAFVSGLINGRGRFNGVKTPLDYMVVKYGTRHLFRMVNTGGDFGFEVSIDNHDLIVKSSDGWDFHSIKVQSIILYPGESYDFEIDTYSKPGKYWVRSISLRHNDHHEVQAVLAYEGHNDEKVDPTSQPRECTAENLCYVFNCPYAGYAGNHYKRCISIADARSSDIGTSYSHGVFDDRVEEYFFNFAFTNGPSINSIRFVEPKVPLFQKYTSFDLAQCDPEKCREKCSCTNIVNIPYNRTMQFVITNYNTKNPLAQGHHPAHIHGHGFAVMKMGYPEYDRNTGLKSKDNPDITCIGKLCSQQRWNHRPRLNYKNPPIKDTVIIPAGGYAVIRFRTDNPGYWFFHCHMDSHANAGMSVLLSEATSRIPHPPHSMPTCRHFYWSEDEFNSYINSQMKFDDYINSRFYGFRGFSGAFSAEEEKRKKENEAATKDDEQEPKKTEGQGDQEKAPQDKEDGNQGEPATDGNKGIKDDHNKQSSVDSKHEATGVSEGQGGGDGGLSGEIGFEGNQPQKKEEPKVDDINHELESESGAGAEGESEGETGQGPHASHSAGDSQSHSEPEGKINSADNEPLAPEGQEDEHKAQQGDNSQAPSESVASDGDGAGNGPLEGKSAGSGAHEAEKQPEVSPKEDNKGHPEPDNQGQSESQGADVSSEDHKIGQEDKTKTASSGDGHHSGTDDHGSRSQGQDEGHQEEVHKDTVILYFLARQLMEHGERGDNYIIAYDTRRDMLSIYNYRGNVGKLGRNSPDYERVSKTSFPIYTVKLEHHYWSPHDLYVGSHIDFDHRKYVIADCNTKTFEYMEKHPDKYPKSDIRSILNKVQKYGADKKEEVRRMDPTNGSGVLGYEDFKKQILKIAAGHVVEHEILTLARHYKVSGRQQRNNAYGPPKFYKFLYGSNGQVNYREFMRRLDRHGYSSGRWRGSRKEDDRQVPVPAGSVDYQSLVRDLFS